MYISYDSLYGNQLYSIIISLLMCLGLSKIGRLTLVYIFKIDDRELSAFDTIIGAITISTLLYIYIIVGNLSKLLIGCIFYFVLIIGFIKITEINIYKIIKELKANFYIYCILFLYFINASFPPTDSDSMNTHLGVATYIINYGKLPNDLSWFHSRLAGSYEVLLAIGVSKGALQFGNYLQFSGLYAIISLIGLTSKLKGNKIMLQAIVVSIPLMLWLTATPKPQLILSSSVLLVFYYLYYKGLSLKRTILIGLILGSAILIKISYIVPAIVMTLTYLMINRNIKNKYLFLILPITIISLVLPSYISKFFIYDDNLLNTFVKLFPGNFPGYTRFLESLSSYTDSSLQFPLNLIFPSSFGVITTIIGPGILIILYYIIINYKNYYNNKNLTSIIFFVFLNIIFGVIFGQKTGRNYLDLFLIIVVTINLLNINIYSYNIKYLNTFVKFQCFAVITILLFNIYSCIPSLFSRESYYNYMTQKANGFEEMQWVKKYLKDDDIIISDSRSYALYPQKFYSIEFLNYTLNKEEYDFYLNTAKIENITHILVHGSPDNHKLKDYLGEAIAGPVKMRIATRNPFNVGASYDVYLYSFNSNRK